MIDGSAATAVVWIVDTSSIIAVRRLPIAASGKARIFQRLAELVSAKRVFYPIQVVRELERNADPENPDPQYQWAAENQVIGCSIAPTLDEVKAVLAVVPDVLDPDKDSGEDEADPYVLALAVRLRLQGVDARIVAQETRDTPTKISIGTAAGAVGVPSLPLAGLLRVEAIPTV